ncbi:receptor-like protein 12 [Durio zibethinus]|uniref:Receptor-like protein 12 n=1 Tax=Durio zibethinus TaxID=66656 RepID=A0A6P5Y515_DURZI|nr:receptor-like protein 12 [Durio zibethinus]
MVQGRLPTLPPSLPSFGVTENYLVGEIPGSSICNMSSLEDLDLSQNNFDGIIPECLGNLSHSLSVMDLFMNNFHGVIPAGIFPKGCSLKSFRIDSNQVEGPIPQSLVNCLDLEILDLGNNDLNDTFPSCLPIKIFENLYAMINGSERKGLERQFLKILTILMVIDFSNNRFDGQIPEILGQLHSLVVLNLSHNGLTGPIPSSFGNLSMLESLDLSSNKLQGRIPQALKNLGFLAVLNLSQNNLTGPIPGGKQFDTFTNDSYSGNLDLYGFPLSKSCGNNDQKQPPTKTDRDDALNWKFSILMGYGCGLVFGLSTGYIVFTTGKPWWFIKIIELCQQKYFGRKIRRSGGRK